MATKTETSAVDRSRIKALFVNLDERTKSAREQIAAGRTKLVAFNKDNGEALKASGRIAGTGVKALGVEVVANIKREFAAASDGPKTFAGVKSFLGSARDDTKAFGQHLGKVAGDVVQPLKSRVAAVTARPKAATVKLASPALELAKPKVDAAANHVEQLAA